MDGIVYIYHIINLKKSGRHRRGGKKIVVDVACDAEEMKRFVFAGFESRMSLKKDGNHAG